MPTADKEYDDTLEFRKFRRQLFHMSLVHILQSVEPWMSKPHITRCGDGHLRCVIYGLGPYIADYPEQVLLAWVVSGWCPKWVSIKFCLPFQCSVVWSWFRCTARPTNLDDDPTAILRSHEHTNMVLKTFEDELSTPWQGYGIISDVRVCLYINTTFDHAVITSTRLSHHFFCMPIFIISCLRICSIKWSKGHSKTISWTG